MSLDHGFSISLGEETIKRVMIFAKICLSGSKGESNRVRNRSKLIQSTNALSKVKSRAERQQLA